jgi:hypothetical protein
MAKFLVQKEMTLESNKSPKNDLLPRFIFPLNPTQHAWSA